MRTLYLRNVPDDVAERLARLAARESLSVGALAVRELAAASRRADNPALLEQLADHGISSTAVVAGLDADRGGRSRHGRDQDGAGAGADAGEAAPDDPPGARSA